VVVQAGIDDREAAALGLIRIFSEDKELKTGDKKGLAGKYRKPSECFFKATPAL
jgi:hypothetical protein